MGHIVSFPIDRARKPGEDIPAIIAIRGCEIRDFARPRIGAAPEPDYERAPLSLDMSGFLPDRLRRPRRRPTPKIAPALPEAEKQEPLARLRGLTAVQARDEIAILLEISDSDLAVAMLVSLIGASNTHKPLPHGWPKVMYAIRGRVSLHVACGRNDNERLLTAIRQLLAEETSTAWA